MLLRPLLSAFAIGILSLSALPGAATSNRTVLNLNPGWLFLRGDLPDGQESSRDESAFKPVSVPHTVAIVKHRNTDTSAWAGISWYRRHFTPPAEYRGRSFAIEFQAVSKAATVYLNGLQVGEHMGGYTPFTVDITRRVKTGEDNVLAVRVDSRQRKDIPPEGTSVDYMVCGGIVRNVSMLVTDPLHIDRTFIVRDPEKQDGIVLSTTIVNGDPARKHCTLITHLLDSSGLVKASDTAELPVGPDSSFELRRQIGPIPGLRLWHPDHPCLYTAVLRIEEQGRCIDEFRQRIGIRTIAFSKKTGAFSINGESLKLRGLNRHETFPFIGRAAADRLQRRDADLLKFDYGCNLVRCSHYPQAPAFLDRCDEIGLLVIEEIPGWLFVGNTGWQSQALRNVEEMVVRDRNHPSVIGYGVRVNESVDFHDFYSKTNRMAHALDQTRPTFGARVTGRGSPREFLEDVWGQNFDIPAGTPRSMPFIMTESVGTRATPHSWDSDSLLDRQMLMHAAALDSVEANPRIAGVIGWCAFDYNSPWYSAEKMVNYHGIADIFRFPKHAAWLYRSQADPARYGPMVYSADYWQKGAAKRDIWVAGNCTEVELFVNGKSLGRRSPDVFGSLPHPLAVWRSVPFAPGELKTVGYRDGKAVATFSRFTAGDPVAVQVVPDDTILETGGDMTRVTVTAVDAHGYEVPRAGRIVSIAVSGPGEFLGENPVRLENGKTAFYIKTLANLPGTITCQVSSPGLSQSAARIAVHNDSGRKDAF
jgi:beta-galactosidase